MVSGARRPAGAGGDADGGRLHDFSRRDDAERRRQVVNLAGAILGAAFGAIIGSFLATLVIRLPKDEQAITGRSRCDHCRRELRAHELVPIASRLWLRGRCPACGARIDPIHWQVEVGAAAIGGLSLGIAPDMAGLSLALFGLMLLPLAWLDWGHFWLSARLVLPLSLWGLVFGGLLGTSLVDRLIGGLAGWAVLGLLSLAYRSARGREGLGLGDPKLLGAIGFWLGGGPLGPAVPDSPGVGRAAA